MNARETKVFKVFFYLRDSKNVLFHLLLSILIPL